jgi:hypothetical protein
MSRPLPRATHQSSSRDKSDHACPSSSSEAGSPLVERDREGGAVERRHRTLDGSDRRLGDVKLNGQPLRPIQRESGEARRPWPIVAGTYRPDNSFGHILTAMSVSSRGARGARGARGVNGARGAIGPAGPKMPRDEVLAIVDDQFSEMRKQFNLQVTRMSQVQHEVVLQKDTTELRRQLADVHDLVKSLIRTSP